MGKKTPPHPPYPSWTSARWWGFLRSGLRNLYSRWPPKYEILNEAKRPVTGKGRQKWEYQCNVCKNYFPKKEVEVNHLEPCGTLRDWQDLVPFTQKLFCSKEGLEVVCKECHKQISKDQKGEK